MSIVSWTVEPSCSRLADRKLRILVDFLLHKRAWFFFNFELVWLLNAADLVLIALVIHVWVANDPVLSVVFPNFVLASQTATNKFKQSVILAHVDKALRSVEALVVQGQHWCRSENQSFTSYLVLLNILLPNQMLNFLIEVLVFKFFRFIFITDRFAWAK